MNSCKGAFEPQGLWGLFHHLWSRDVGTVGYDKKKWTALEKEILNTERKKQYAVRYNWQDCHDVGRPHDSYAEALKELEMFKQTWVAKSCMPEIIEVEQ